MYRVLACIAAVVLAGGLATGCAATASERTSAYRVPAGSQLILEKELQRFGGSRRIYFQAGSRIARDARDRYAPYCFFRLGPGETAGLPNTIGPATFRVEASSLGTDRVGHREQPGVVRVASRELARLRLTSRGGGSYSFFAYETTMAVASKDEPKVRSLVCARFANPLDQSRSHYLTPGQLKQALAGVARLVPPETAGE